MTLADRTANRTDDGARLLTRQIRELTVERARLRRHRVEAAGSPADSPAALGGLDAASGRLGDEIDHRRDHLTIVASTGSYQPWTYRHFDLGDFVRIGGAWYPVLSVGWRALKVPPLEMLGERRYHANPERGVDMDSVAYVRVYGRRRAGRVLHTPPPPAGATCTCRVIIPTFNSEFVPEQDGGPCTRPPVARLTVRHDGTACSCNGMCLLPDTDATDSAGAGTRAPWVEVVLFCDAHAYEYAADIAAAEPPTTTVEELT